jgi:hypothetical protein
MPRSTRNPRGLVLPRRGRVSAAKRAANRRNARRSTGPRTAAGKARAARNARRHGLTVSPVTDPAFMREAAALARAIMGTDPESQSPESQAPTRPERLRAMQIAIAHVQVLQVRRAKCALYARGLGWDELTRQLASLDRYERHALARRKMAMRPFDASRNFASAPKRSHRSESVSDINRLAQDSGPAGAASASARSFANGCVSGPAGRTMASSL